MLSGCDRTLIRNCRLFDGIGMDSLEGIVDYCPVMELHTDEILLTPNQENDCVYIVLEGRLAVHLADIEAPGNIELEAGECVGELSLVANRTTSAYVVAATECRVLMVPPDALWSLINHSHGVARNLLHLIAGRLKKGARGIITHIAEHQRFEHVSSVDGLTGLHNRLWLEGAFARAVRRCARNDQPLSLLLIDIDHFRSYNENHGQLAGDAVLCALAREITQSLRPTDMVARFGGEEFAVLLPEASLLNTFQVAERLRVAAIETEFGKMGGVALPPVTVSVGVAEMQSGDTLSALIAAAEAALYRAKFNGRNRVELPVERVIRQMSA